MGVFILERSEGYEPGTVREGVYLSPGTAVTRFAELVSSMARLDSLNYGLGRDEAKPNSGLSGFIRNDCGDEVRLTGVVVEGSETFSDRYVNEAPSQEDWRGLRDVLVHVLAAVTKTRPRQIKEATPPAEGEWSIVRRS